MNSYLQRQALYSALIKEPIKPDTYLCIVIPALAEEKLINTLETLLKCRQPNCNVEVISVINHGEHISEDLKELNKKIAQETQNWVSNQLSSISFHVVEMYDLRKKHAGAGLARKIGMDEAVRRFDSIHQDGIIICLDGDCLVEANYLIELERHFKENPKTPGCSVNFEHPITGDEYDEAIYNGILNYELHLRYYLEGMKLTGFPNAFHTVGSSIAVRSSAYQKQGGMNKRKAGEDFYFVNKIALLGNYSELNTTTVYPSPRTSWRVPFGTGKAMNDWVNSEQLNYTTYHPRAFFHLRDLFRSVLENQRIVLQKFHSSLQEFLKDQKLAYHLHEIEKHSTNSATFKKRFFQWFDAFKILKYVHHHRDNQKADIPLNDAVNLFFPTLTEIELKEKLLFLRNKQKKNFS